MDTLEVLVPAEPELHDLLVSGLSDIGFEAFLESDSDLRAYIPVEQDSPALRDRTVDITRRAQVSEDPTFRIIRSRNWNEEWERTIGPVEVGRFVILPPWAPEPAEGVIPLWIEPKMSFGTGHHESTRLALALLEETVGPGASVLDAGTGTGVLAIAAGRLGASRIVAFDVDPWSATNCVENVGRNEMSTVIRFVLGELDSVSDTDFDIIVANINRNALMSLLPDLAERVVLGGAIILSGLLVIDRESILRRAADVGLTVGREVSEGDWWAATLMK